MAQEYLLLVGLDQLEDQAHFRRKRDPQPLLAEVGEPASEDGLDSDAEIAVVAVMQLALDLGG